MTVLYLVLHISLWGTWIVVCFSFCPSWYCSTVDVRNFDDCCVVCFEGFASDLVIILVFELGTGKVILESVILTSVVVVSLTLYTFWAARRGHDFNFLGPFLFGAVMVLMVFALIQVHCDRPYLLVLVDGVFLALSLLIVGLFS